MYTKEEQERFYLFMCRMYGKKVELAKEKYESISWFYILNKWLAWNEWKIAENSYLSAVKIYDEIVG